MILTKRTFTIAALSVLTACAAPSASVDKMASGEGPLVKGVSYVGVSVSDLERSAAFYGSSTGMTVVDSRRIAHNSALARIAGGKDIAAETRLLRGGNAQIRLMQFKSPSAAARLTGPMPVQGVGITHVCHQSPAARPLYPRFIEAGAKPVTRGGQPIRLVAEVPWRYAYARDADGIMFENEIVEADPPPPYEHRVSHVAIATADIERTVKFYTALLGREPRERRYNLARPTLDQVADLDGVKLDVAWYTIGNLELEIWQYLSPAPVPVTGPRPIEALGYNMIVLDVSDVAAAEALLVAAGGKGEGKPVAMDGGRVAFGRDPDGNLIGLQSVAPASIFSSSAFKSRETPPA
jgi:catechol 2,3-dioxygenase-like lactoylglutathione lyase family enzyme